MTARYLFHIYSLVCPCSSYLRTHNLYGHASCLLCSIDNNISLIRHVQLELTLEWRGGKGEIIISSGLGV